MDVKSNGHHDGGGDRANGNYIHTSAHDKTPRDIYGVIKDFDANAPHPFIYRLYPTTTDKIIVSRPTQIKSWLLHRLINNSYRYFLLLSLL